MRKRTAAEYVQLSITVAICVVAVVVGVVDTAGDIPEWVSLPGITVGVLGALILYLVKDHQQTEHRLKSIEDLNLHSRLLGLSKEALTKVDTALSDYVQIYAHWKLQKKRTPPTASFVLEFMDQHFDMLQRLARGRIKVQHRQSSYVQHLLLEHFRTRFDAVSDRDLQFWLDTQSSDYHQAITNSCRRHQTVVNRIFIFTKSELETRADEIARILRVQQHSGFGWGVAIWEEIDYHQRHNTSNVFDFAFSDNDGVLTYFRKDDPKRPRSLEVVLHVQANESEMQRQRDLYAHMVGECWLVNSRFLESYNGVLTPEQCQRAREIGTKSNDQVMKMLGSRPDLVQDGPLAGSSLKKLVPESAPEFFLLLSTDTEKVGDDLQKLRTILDAMGGVI